PHNMKTGILSIAFALLLATSFGQGKDRPDATGSIVGKLIDSATHLPLQSATISLLATGKTRVLNRTTSDSSGDFGLTNVRPGSYTVVIEYVGYRTINIRNVIVTQTGDIVNLKTIHAIPKTNTEQAVIVTAPPKLIDNKIDKLVFNAERD